MRHLCECESNRIALRVLFAGVEMFARVLEYGPVQPELLLLPHAVVALTANAYVVHALRPVTFTEVAFVFVFTALTYA